MAIWMENEVYCVCGAVGFVTSTTGEAWFRLQHHPARNGLLPVLVGRGSDADGYSVYARGVGRVTRVARNGRIQVTMLRGTDLSAALEALGYPDLIPPASNGRSAT